MILIFNVKIRSRANDFILAIAHGYTHCGIVWGCISNTIDCFQEHCIKLKRKIWKKKRKLCDCREIKMFSLDWWIFCGSTWNLA